MTRLFLAALLATAAAPVRAEEVAADEQDRTIVVTGQRTGDEAVSAENNVGILGDRDVFSTPFSTTGYTDELIRNQQARAIADVIANDSSVRLASSRYAESENFTIRGFPVYTTLFNGLPGLVDTRQPFLDGIARVEVFKGPSGLVNGASQEVGGTINFVPKRASDGGDASLTLGYASDLQGEVHTSLGRRFGADGEFGALLSSGFRYGDTPLDNQVDRALVNALALDYRGERLRVSLDASYQDRRFLAELSGFTVLPGFDVPRAPDASNNVFDRSTFYRKRNGIALLSAEYEPFDGVTLFANAGHSRTSEFYFGPYSPTIVDPDGTTTVLNIPYGLRGRSYTYRVGARAAFATGPITHALTVSGERFIDRYRGAYAVKETLVTNIYDPVPLAPQVIDYPVPPDQYRRRSINQSVVIADVASLADDRVVLIAGARRVTIGSRSTDAVTGNVDSNYRQSRTTPAVAFLVKPVPRLTLYGNYIQSLQEGPVAPTGTVNADEVFPPFVAKQYEVGAKYEIAPGAGLTLAAFEITRASSFVDAATNRFRVDGEQRNRGIEFTAFGTVAPGLRLLGGATYLDAEQARTADTDLDGRGDLDGLTATGVPDWQVNAGIEVDATPQLTFTGRLLYTSKEFVDPDNARSIPAWTRYDLGVRYTAQVAGKPLILRASVENLTNHDYWSSSQGGYLAIGAPRTVLLSVSRDF